MSVATPQRENQTPSESIGRRAIKAVARGLAVVAVLPLLAVYHLQAMLVGKDRALEGASQLLAIVPGFTGRYLRNAFLRFSIAECHPTATIEFGTIFSKASARLGAYAYIGPYCTVGLVDIGNHVLVGPHVNLLSGGRTHDFQQTEDFMSRRAPSFDRITLGPGCWIGAAATVMGDVGDDAIVGAGAVVVAAHPVPAGAVAAGVPARCIGVRGVSG